MLQPAKDYSIEWKTIVEGGEFTFLMLERVKANPDVISYLMRILHICSLPS